MSNLKVMLSQTLKAELKKHNLSVNRLAQEIGVPKSCLQDWITSTSIRLNQKNITYLDKISKYFGIPVVNILFGSNLESSKSIIISSSTFRDDDHHYRVVIEKFKDGL